ncbi:MAG: hypothetical protein QOE51_4199 [Actinoplanes sp.]|jgi:hypothetical protein|nr:hypothetical protein [Actinoplanes sp.]
MRSAEDAALASFARYVTGTQLNAKDYVFGTGVAQEANYFEQVAPGPGSPAHGPAGVAPCSAGVSPVVPSAARGPTMSGVRVAVRLRR